MRIILNSDYHPLPWDTGFYHFRFFPKFVATTKITDALIRIIWLTSPPQNGQLGRNMPVLKTRMLFISHAWAHSSHYDTIVSWFNDAVNFDWKNCSVPSHDALPDKTSKGLSEGMRRQIAPAQGVIILAGMYAAHSDWINYEIEQSIRMNKFIIGVRPWGQERVPVNVQNASNILVGWNGNPPCK